MLASLLMLTVAVGDRQVTAAFADPANNREGLVAEQIRRPETISSEAFADELVEAEKLTSWSSQDPTTSAPGERLAWRARHGASGREVVVYFSPDKQTVCRIRRRRGGTSDPHYRAVRWCAASLGITLSAERAPPARAN